MKYTKILLFFGLFLVSPTLLFAQKKILTEKVEVTKSYVPTIGKASKRDIQPTAEDVMQIEMPRLQYTISYKPEKYPFMITPLEMPSYKIAEQDKLYHGYADAALGIPFSSSMNLFYTSTELRNTIFGASLNHKGFWGKLKDNTGVERKAKETENDLSLFFEYMSGNLKTKISATQSYDAFNRYGFNQPDIADDIVNRSLKQHFMKTSVNAEIGTSFEDLNKFNINLGASVNIVSDKYSYSESLYQIGVLLSKGFSKINSRIEARVEYLSDVPSRDFKLYQIYGKTPIDFPTTEPGQLPTEYIDYSPSGILSVAPRYLFNYKGLDIDLGVNMSFDFNGDDNNYRQGVSTILPQVQLAYGFANGAVRPFAKIDGRYIVNNYYTLSEQNPYIMEGLTAPNTTIRRYLVGIGGTIQSNFTYEVYVGLRQSRDLLMYVNIENGNLFAATSDDFDNTEYSIELGYMLNPTFGINLKAKYIDYDNTGSLRNNIAIGHAPFTGNLMINYVPTKKLSFVLDGEFLSGRKFGSVVMLTSGSTAVKELTINEVSGVFDLSLAAEYKLSKRTAISLKGGNLLNQKLYSYNNYRGIGLNVMAGISFKF